MMRELIEYAINMDGMITAARAVVGEQLQFAAMVCMLGQHLPRLPAQLTR